MTTTLATTTRNAACNATVDLVDAGSGPGKVRIKSGGGTVIGEVPFNDPAFGNASSGAAVLAGTTPLVGAGVSAAGGGTAAATFDVTDSDNNVIWSGAVGNGSGELDLDNVNIADGQVIQISSWTHTQPA